MIARDRRKSKRAVSFSTDVEQSGKAVARVNPILQCTRLVTWKNYLISAINGYVRVRVENWCGKKDITVELRQLQAFVAVAEELHFRAAADRVGMAQAALSTKIKRLEEELGFPLLFRTTRHVSLTQAGTVFLKEVHATLACLENGVRQAELAADSRFERLRIGGIDAALIWYLPPVIEAFKARLPNLSLPMTEVSGSDEQITNLQSHRIDLAFFRPPTNAPGIKFETLVEEHVLVALPKSHYLAEKKEGLTVEDLADEPLINFPRNARPYLHDLVIKSFSEKNLRPKIAMEVTEKLTMMRLIELEMGLGLVPEWIGVLRPKNIVFRPFLAANARLKFGVAWRQNERNQTVMEFLEIVKDHADLAQKELKRTWKRHT